MEKEHSNLPIENSKKNELKPASLVRYENMSNELLELYKRKNADYGDSITNKICPTKISWAKRSLLHFIIPARLQLWWSITSLRLRNVSSTRYDGASGESNLGTMVIKNLEINVSL